jgi:arsenate reductase (thioredoxin)
VSEQRTVLFVCLHGMGMSRLAAAFFNSSAPAGWQAVSAGLEPGEALSLTAARLLAGTSAEPFLDRAAPRSIGSAPSADRVIAICNPAIRFEVSGAETWDLANAEFDAPMRDEIHARAELLAEQLGHD